MKEALRADALTMYHQIPRPCTGPQTLNRSLDQGGSHLLKERSLMECVDTSVLPPLERTGTDIEGAVDKGLGTW